MVWYSFQLNFDISRQNVRKRLSAIDKAFRAARKSALFGVRAGHGGPFGAAVLLDDKIIAVAHNTVLRDNDPTAHAEINALRKAARKLGAVHLDKCILIATSEPCPMCHAAILWARVRSTRFAVPIKAAARVGFGDSLILRKIIKAKNPRRCRSCPIHDKAHEASCLTIFEEWQRRNAKLY